MSYATTRDHLLDELHRITAILQAVDPTTNPGTAPDADGDVDLARDPGALELALTPEGREKVADHEDRIEQKCDATADETTLRLRTLADRFGLSRNHLDVLLLALAPDFDPQYEDSFRTVQDDTGATNPTVGFIASLFARGIVQQYAASALVGPSSPLRQHGLVELSEPVGASRSYRNRLVLADIRLLTYLEGHDDVDAALDPIAEIDLTTASVADLRIDGQTREEVERLQTTAATGERRVHYFHGPDGAEKERAVQALTGPRVIRADLGELLDAELLDRFRREAVLQDCPVHLTGVTVATEPRGAGDETDGEERPDSLGLDWVVESLTALERDLYLTGADEWTPEGNPGDADYAIREFPKPGVDLRRQLWERHADRLPETVDPAVLASTFGLTPAEIDDAVATATALSDSHQEPAPTLSREDVLEGCRAQSSDAIEELAEHIEPSRGWDEIVLPPDTEDQLREVAARVKHRGTVFDDWGFDEQFSRGTGVIAMFAGPSGTGKTMAAEIIATVSGMDLYKVDLSSVVSKFIGETEENLEEVFEAARDSSSILLFDEADAVFGQRAGVNDASDRYANVEVDFLLQRIERYDGVVLMTTNYASNVDDAFMRRIHQTVSFERPDRTAREQIWRVTFPDDTPTAGLDYNCLGKLELTGGNIRNVAQTAAVHAAADGEQVTMQHVLKAVQREYDKLDKMLDPSTLGEYRGLLEQTSIGSEERSAEWQDGGSDPAGERPEDVVETLFERLGGRADADPNELFHSSAVDDQFTAAERRFLTDSDLSIGDEFQRVVSEPDRTVLRFAQSLNGDRTVLEYELRTDDGRWRIWDTGDAATQ